MTSEGFWMSAIDAQMCADRVVRLSETGFSASSRATKRAVGGTWTRKGHARKHVAKHEGPTRARHERDVANQANRIREEATLPPLGLSFPSKRRASLHVMEPPPCPRGSVVRDKESNMEPAAEPR